MDLGRLPAPMQAVAWPAPFSDDAWWFEPKWDGYRCVAGWDGAELSLRSRTGKDLAVTFPELGAPADTPVILDGEIVVLGDDGTPSFGALQRHIGEGGGDLAVFVFDILATADGPLANRPLGERLAMLDTVDLAAPWHRSPGVTGIGEALWETLMARSMEGMVAKRLASTYAPGRRSPDWRKIVARRSARGVVVGYTRGEGAREPTFGALVLALPTPEGLRWIGMVGTGFDDDTLVAIRHHLDQMTVETRPILPDPELPAGITWVEPRLVAHVTCREWTGDDKLRHPSFKGFGPEDPAEVSLTAERDA